MYNTYKELEYILQAKTNLDFLTHLRAYLAKRRSAGDLTSFRSAANFRQPDSEKVLSQLVEKFLPEDKRTKLFTDFATDILLFRVRLKLKTIGDLLPDLELFCSAVEIEEHKSTTYLASAPSSLFTEEHPSIDGPVSRTEYASAQTCQVNLLTDPMTDIGMTPLRAYIDKYLNGSKPDRFVQDMIDMKSPKEETFFMSLDQYLAGRKTRGSLGDMVFWEDISHSRWERVFFKSPTATQESVFSFVSSQTQAHTQASGTPSVYAPYTMTVSVGRFRSANEIMDPASAPDTCTYQPSSQP